MKSERGSDEIFGAPPQMKLNPSPLPAKRDFIAKRFHPTKVGFIPAARTDLVEKSHPHYAVSHKDINCV